MDLRRTLASAILGAAIGLGLHLALGAFIRSNANWFAIVTGAITGLSVRQASRAFAGHVSYLRGAIAALVAMVAILASLYLVEVVIAKTSVVREPTPPPKFEVPAPVPKETSTPEEASTHVETPASDDTPSGEVSTPDSESKEPNDKPVAESDSAKSSLSSLPKDTAIRSYEMKLPELNLRDFLLVTIGVLLAYEFARGTGARRSAVPNSEAA